jgi:hypothetical protein
MISAVTLATAMAATAQGRVAVDSMMPRTRTKSQKANLASGICQTLLDDTYAVRAGFFAAQMGDSVAPGHMDS